MKSKSNFAMLSLVAALACTGLVGCGGGGGGGGSETAGAGTGGGTGTGTGAGTGSGTGSGGGSAPTNSGTATLQWSRPTTNADGTALTDLAGYRIYYGTSSGSYGQPITIASPYTETYKLENLPTQKTYYVVVKAIDTSNNESAASPEQSKYIQ